MCTIGCGYGCEWTWCFACLFITLNLWAGSRVKQLLRYHRAACLKMFGVGFRFTMVVAFGLSRVLGLLSSR